MKKRVAGLVCLVVFLLGIAGLAFAGPGAVSEGTVKVFKNGKLSARLSGVSPVDEGSLLICEGKCMIKANGVSILARDKAELAIASKGDTFNLYVRKGHVEFVVSKKTSKIDFYTPEGAYSVADMMFNASTSPVVRGYMEADASGTRVGVREGGMIFNTAEGPKTVKADEYIVLAMADVDKKGGGAPVGQAAPQKSFFSTPAGQTTVAVLAVGTVVGLGLAVSNNNGGGGGGGNPGQPSPSQ
jgi:hypothetical protein